MPRALQNGVPPVPKGKLGNKKGCVFNPDRIDRDSNRGIHMDSVKLICIQVNICESTLFLSADNCK
eukprot:SAG22_NODE_395_length_11139_cov_14.562500_13_plen_66_part_00